MPARDPVLRREIARRASQAHLSRLDAEGRRRMTSAARAAADRVIRDEALRELAEREGYSGPFPSALVDQVAEDIRRKRLSAMSRLGVAARQRRARERDAAVGYLTQALGPEATQRLLAAS